MAITAADILYRLSGGASNSDPLLALGGVMSTTTNAGTNIFDDVTGAESQSGNTEYRGVYILNNHGSLTYQGMRVWVSTDTPSADTDADIALCAEGVNATMATIANEDTAPATVTFTNTAVSYATGLPQPSGQDLTFGQRYGVWIKRVVNAGAAAYADSFTITCQGDTNP